MDFLPSEITKYSEDITTDESEVLYQLSRETNMKVLRPRMLSGKLQGKLLQFISRMINPDRILEVGTYTGYSAICLAQGLAGKGVLHTIDNNPELENIIRKYITKAGLNDKIVLHIGEAVDVIPKLDETLDLVFLDADKENYITYYEMVMKKLRTGGFILADNVLWSGKVLQRPAKNDTETRKIIDFNNHVSNDMRVDNMILPFRDGLMMVRKK